ncbi:gp53-like domain-containing protein [Pseudomonas sp. RL_15y_Pfl2_60]|uniref:gp53-like domain-containing protein n=1 Tax=Pseudomonas sp. RL_15y_Pfl2_60 TaxID=3088709 RepID=UPI00403FAE0F
MGGLILQWMTAPPTASGSSSVVTFPIAFPSSCRQLFAGYRGGVVAGLSMPSFGDVGLTQATIYNNNTSAGSMSPAVLAIGY